MILRQCTNILCSRKYKVIRLLLLCHFKRWRPPVTMHFMVDGTVFMLDKRMLHPINVNRLW